MSSVPRTTSWGNSNRGACLPLRTRFLSRRYTEPSPTTRNVWLVPSSFISPWNWIRPLTELAQQNIGKQLPDCKAQPVGCAKSIHGYSRDSTRPADSSREGGHSGYLDGGSPRQVCAGHTGSVFVAEGLDAD